VASLHAMKNTTITAQYSAEEGSEAKQCKKNKPIKQLEDLT
jgi:hypothetical protein